MAGRATDFTRGILGSLRRRPRLSTLDKPRTHARATSITRRGRSSSGCMRSNHGRPGPRQASRRCSCVDGNGHWSESTIPLGPDAALAWFSDGSATRLTTKGGETLRLHLKDAAALEPTGGAFALIREKNDTGRLVELDAGGRIVLPGSELVAPPITRLLGGEREVIVATALNAFVLGAKGQPVELRERDPIACSSSRLAEARDWPLSVRAR